MHSLMGLAGFLGLVGLAFGKRAASVVAAIILLGVPALIALVFLWHYLITIGVLPPFYL